MNLSLDSLGFFQVPGKHLTENVVCLVYRFFSFFFFFGFTQRITFLLGYISFYIFLNTNFLLIGIIFMPEFYIKLQH